MESLYLAMANEIQLTKEEQKECMNSKEFLEALASIEKEENEKTQKIFQAFQTNLFSKRTIQHATQNQIVSVLTQYFQKQQLVEWKSFRLHHRKASLLFSFVAIKRGLPSSTQEDLTKRAFEYFQSEETQKMIHQFQDRCTNAKKWASSEAFIHLPPIQIQKLDEKEKQIIDQWKPTQLMLTQQKEWLDLLLTPVPQFIVKQFEMDNSETKISFSNEIPSLLSSAMTHQMTQVTQFASMLAKLRQNEDPFAPSPAQVKVEPKDMHLALSLQPFQSNSLFLKQQRFMMSKQQSTSTSSNTPPSFSKFGAFDQPCSFHSPFETHYDFLSTQSQQKQKEEVKETEKEKEEKSQNSNKKRSLARSSSTKSTKKPFSFDSNKENKVVDCC